MIDLRIEHAVRAGQSPIRQHHRRADVNVVLALKPLFLTGGVPAGPAADVVINQGPAFAQGGEDRLGIVRQAAGPDEQGAKALGFHEGPDRLAEQPTAPEGRQGVGQDIDQDRNGRVGPHPSSHAMQSLRNAVIDLQVVGNGDVNAVGVHRRNAVHGQLGRNVQRSGEAADIANGFAFRADAEDRRHAVEHGGVVIGPEGKDHIGLEVRDLRRPRFEGLADFGTRDRLRCCAIHERRM